MKELLHIIFVLVVTVCMSCGDSKEPIEGKPGASIEQFTIRCGGTYYRGTVDETNKVVRIGGVTSRLAITEVKYQLSGGASISPKPEETERWEVTQTFTVTGSDNQTSVYTVNLPDLQEDPAPVQKKVVIGYLPLSDYYFDTEFENLHWEYITHVNASFLLVNVDGSVDEGKVSKNIKRAVDFLHKKGVKVIISLAKKESGAFTAAIKDEEARSNLVNNIINFTITNGLDGFDIDYEEYDTWGSSYPYLMKLFKELQEARNMWYEDTGEKLLMTCAVNAGWLNHTEEWEQYFDYINIMSYDKYMPNATNPPGQHASYDAFVSDLHYWLQRAPKSKIVGGLPFYGYSWDSKTGKDDIGAIRFKGILKYYGATPEVADADSQGGQTFYNGRPTIRQKCQYVLDEGYAGVMIWQLFQDAEQENLKLLNVVGEVLGGSL